MHDDERHGEYLPRPQAVVKKEFCAVVGSGECVRATWWFLDRDGDDDQDCGGSRDDHPDGTELNASTSALAHQPIPSQVARPAELAAAHFHFISRWPVICGRN